MTDHDYMREALSLAQKAKGFVSPNPCVGAVVVKDKIIVGKGFHRAAGLAHAEVEAIDDAGPKAKDATLYVTLEPCNHFGKTPPCTHKIINAGIKKVVVGCKDPNPNVCGGGINFLEENGIKVISGVLEKEAATLIEEFIWYVQNNKKPFVILKCASTLDGRIATATGDSKWITNEKSRGYVHQIRHEVDAILVGSGTVNADDPSLTSRICGVQTKDPVRIILDTHLSIKPDAKILTQASTAGTIIVTSSGVSKEKKAKIERHGVQILEVPLKGQRLDLNKLMIKLGQMSILSLLIEGGSVVAGSALKAGIVNKVLFFLAPKFLGGSDGIPVFEGTGPALIKDAFELKNVTVKPFDSDILVQGYLI
ncbi:MAG: bifunctional diaminohydroxyphosphoribosylaminopyrimidine deaminase/5-amino-6-(5-phosphoribosylamino)uracil reductase RibD [Proteobacteria bacterium]|nr:bifunctional diaminohydroxyphosphoribosylaminopyrimidine deaminase/5-amino-6-(5-phosphoribosylamino)uracil reductase RibD [Pseudomonadota bacterium]MBU1583515.1 bifunctional diaminohydroxyphosphoribosylaminopyrimidine deaminase/5-amino-6-(5-phosphoribosylamino)uracil reductase RibD [Pseudomonadota bacterium]MBU2454312.1 bifunctional diaminohydroxyphosphoribosylaminopyrimidine deaminase/5-amino-6-(5-phosphoribosylamino)uracil reductase RibD [Pseudomonadota bacterium]MBU2629592.1 bifunctional d